MSVPNTQRAPRQIQCGQGCDKTFRQSIPYPDDETSVCRTCSRRTWVAHVDQDTVASFCMGTIKGDRAA